MASGGPERFEAFVSEYGERAFQFAYRLSGNVEEAKDLVQEAFFRVLRSWQSYDGSRSLDAWFFTILRNVFLDGRKRYERRHGVSLDAPAGGRDGECSRLAELLPDEEEAVLDRLQRAETARFVREALEELPYDHRTVLTLCDMEGLSYEEISNVLDVPVGTVRSRISRARDSLARRLADRVREGA